jgi:acyl carrier protein
MTHDEIRRTVLDAVAEIAPEADLDAVDPAANLQAQFDLDSFDFLNLVVALSERLGVEVPEQDYADMATLDDCTGYLERRVAALSSS